MQSEDDLQPVLLLAFYRVLKQLAHVAIRYGVSAGAVSDLVRRAFVDAATESLEREGKKPMASRLGALTGLYRKEIVRLQSLPPPGDTREDDRYNRSARVVTGWLQDADFCTLRGRPAVLSLNGDKSFSALVRKYSGDMTPRAMLDELQRLRVIEKTSQGKVKLLSQAYIPERSEIDTLQILGQDTAELIETIRFNLSATSARRFQRKVSYLHIPQRHAEAFRLYAATESQLLLEKLDRWLARRDTEHQSLGTPGSRLGLGIYMIETPNNNADNPDNGVES